MCVGKTLSLYDNLLLTINLIVTDCHSCRHSSTFFGWWFWCCQESNSWISREFQDISCHGRWTWQRDVENDSKNYSKDKGRCNLAFCFQSFFTRQVTYILYNISSFIKSTILQLYEGLADQLTDIVVNAVIFSFWYLFSWEGSSLLIVWTYLNFHKNLCFRFYASANLTNQSIFLWLR